MEPLELLKRLERVAGWFRGFDCVEMSSSSEAQSAINSLDGTQFEGRSLTVNEADPMAKRDNFGGGGRGGGRNRWYYSRFISN